MDLTPELLQQAKAVFQQISAPHQERMAGSGGTCMTFSEEELTRVLAGIVTRTEFIQRWDKASEYLAIITLDPGVP